MKLESNNIVKLKNGLIGAVTSFNGSPSIIVFEKYANPVSHYDENLCKKRAKGVLYDIEEVYDGSSVGDIGSLYSRQFDISSLPLVWKRGQ